MNYEDYTQEMKDATAEYYELCNNLISQEEAGDLQSAYYDSLVDQGLLFLAPPVRPKSIQEQYDEWKRGPQAALIRSRFPGSPSPWFGALSPESRLVALAACGVSLRGVA